MYLSKSILYVCQSCDFLFLRDLRGSSEDLKTKYWITLKKFMCFWNFDWGPGNNKSCKALRFAARQCSKKSEFLLASLPWLCVDYNLILADKRSWADIVLISLQFIATNKFCKRGGRNFTICDWKHLGPESREILRKIKANWGACHFHYPVLVNRPEAN